MGLFIGAKRYKKKNLMMSNKMKSHETLPKEAIGVVAKLKPHELIFEIQRFLKSWWIIEGSELIAIKAVERLLM